MIHCIQCNENKLKKFSDGIKPHLKQLAPFIENEIYDCGKYVYLKVSGNTDELEWREIGADVIECLDELSILDILKIIHFKIEELLKIPDSYYCSPDFYDREYYEEIKSYIEPLIESISYLISDFKN